MRISAIESAALIIGLVVTLTLSGIVPTGASARQTVQVRWLIAHEPSSVFANATETFSETLQNESDGTMSLEVLTRSDLGYEQDVPTQDILAMLDRGDIELSSALVTGLANHDPYLSAIDLPYLFDTYEDLEAALEGSAGAKLLSHLTEATSVRGLAFTLSGGFRIVLADRKIENATDFHDLRIAASGPVSEKILSELGAIQDETGVDGVETTYSRIAGLSSFPSYAYANETNHNVLLTSLIASDRFFDSLTRKQQMALEKAAQAAAQVEREDSIKLAERTRASLQEAGITIVPVERNLFQQALENFTVPGTDASLVAELRSH